MRASSSVRILFSNLGYARGISGNLKDHLRYGLRHLVNSARVRQSVFAELGDLLNEQQPDIVALVEVEQQPRTRRLLEQALNIANMELGWQHYQNKYAAKGPATQLPGMKHKAMALMASAPLQFDALYFADGSKRLVYRVQLADSVELYIAHFALSRKVRARQFTQLREWIDGRETSAIVMGDFNIFAGIGELSPLQRHDGLVLLNDPARHTFRFWRNRMMLDLALVSPDLAPRATVEVFDQPYSDHDALLLELVD